ncbi:hypothetical protein ACEUZ9_004622 [Paracoccus litorisediminis]|uniref:helix-turn-helix domain-containing protein n=1 Tax=Paracoccus litorisediminis TaxID=2006130 RepID=UPI0037347FEE
MDALTRTASAYLAAGDPLAVLKLVALTGDPAGLALRGIAMAQLGDLARARELLRLAVRRFGAGQPLARARCVLAEAEIALVSRDLGRAMAALPAARTVLAARGDRVNAAHAGYLEARQFLLLGRVDQAEALLDGLNVVDLPPPSRVSVDLVRAGIAIRRIRATEAKTILTRTLLRAEATGMPPLIAEVDRAIRMIDAPAARLIAEGKARVVALREIERLMTSDALIVDACRGAFRAGERVIPLARRPVLLSLLRALAESTPAPMARQTLLVRAFGARHADDSHRARLRVEIARLRAEIATLAGVRATGEGFALDPHGGRQVMVLAPATEAGHDDLMALLSDGEAWSSTALSLAMGVSARTVQRALDELRRTGWAERFGRGRNQRWIMSNVPTFPTNLLLPGSDISG